MTCRLKFLFFQVVVEAEANGFKSGTLVSTHLRFLQLESEELIQGLGLDHLGARPLLVQPRQALLESRELIKVQLGSILPSPNTNTSSSLCSALWESNPGHLLDRRIY